MYISGSLVGREGGGRYSDRSSSGAPASPQTMRQTLEVVLQRDRRGGGHSVNQHKQNGDIQTWALLSWDYTSTTHWYELPNNQLTVFKTGLKLELERLWVERHRNKYLLNSALSAHLQICQHLVTQSYILHYLTAAKYYHLRGAVEWLSTVHCTYSRKKPDATSHIGHPPLHLLGNWGIPQPINSGIICWALQMQPNCSTNWRVPNCWVPIL